TNVRAVFLHEFFADRDGVRDVEIAPLVEQALDRRDPRTWYWALLDYGAWLKRSLPNPSRRSAHHTRQSPFEGSRRQKRARLLRAVLALGCASAAELAAAAELGPREATELLESLSDDGLVGRADGGGWCVP
ncbi:MAG: A/G-specific adenine glycosylase, partial [Coriobacteriales bacterium]|nr:A/G-specific adenine glycosylase [Coriobacteriales bacterium]